MAKKTLTLKFPPKAPKGEADDIHLKLQLGYNNVPPIRDQLAAQGLKYDEDFAADVQLDAAAHAQLMKNRLLNDKAHNDIMTAIYVKVAKHIQTRN